MMTPQPKPSPSRCRLCLVPLVAGLLLAAPPARAQGDLDLTRVHIELLDSSWFSGQGASLALDAQGNPHIAYYVERFGFRAAVKYAHHDGTRWHFELVGTIFKDRIGASGLSLALDAAGTPHVAYSDPGLQRLQYAGRRSDGLWTILGKIGDVPEAFPSLALDATGKPHIAYYHEPSQTLHYATLDGASLSSQTIDAGPVGPACSLALDAAGDPHVAYVGAEERGLRYVRRRGAAGFEAPRTVDAGQVDSTVSLAIDEAGDAHIGYVGGASGNRDVQYIRSSGGVFQTPERLGAGNDSQSLRPVSLALDPAGNPHVAFGKGNRGLGYRYRSDGVWLERPFDPADDELPGGTLRGVAIRLAADGTPRIVFAQAAPRYLSVAAGWRIEPVFDQASFPSIQLHRGVPSISFTARDPVTGQNALYLATRAGDGTWAAAEPIGPAGDFLYAPTSDLLYTEAGVPLVSFLVPGGCSPGCSTQIQLAWRDPSSGQWLVEPVIDGESIGYFHKLALGPNGVPTVVYAETEGFGEIRRIRLARRLEAPARRGAGASWQPLPAVLEVEPRGLSALGLPDGRIVVAHTRAAGSGYELHVASWDGTAWSEELVDPGLRNGFVTSSIAYDADGDRLAMAYEDGGSGRYAYQTRSEGWRIPFNPSFLGPPSLGLAGSLAFPRIAASGFAGGGPALVLKRGISAQSEPIDSLDESSRPSIAVGEREHLAYISASGQLRHAVRTLLSGNTVAADPVGTKTETFIDAILLPPEPEDGCQKNFSEFVVGLFSCFGGAQRGLLRAGPDFESYRRHVPELEVLLFENAELFQETYLTLEHLYPVMDALLAGDAQRIAVPTELIEDVRSILTRVRDRASAELAADVGELLLRYDDLHAFEGKNFAQAVELLGGLAPRAVGLPGDLMLLVTVLAVLGLVPRVRIRRHGRPGT